MNELFWWDTNNDGGFVNSILKFSVESRKFYLKADLKEKLKHYILNPTNFEDIICFCERLDIIKFTFGEETGSRIIQEAVKEMQVEFNEPEWEQVVNEKIENCRKVMDKEFGFLN